MENSHLYLLKLGRSRIRDPTEPSLSLRAKRSHAGVNVAAGPWSTHTTNTAYSLFRVSFCFLHPNDTDWNYTQNSEVARDPKLTSHLRSSLSTSTALATGSSTLTSIRFPLSLYKEGAAQSCSPCVVLPILPGKLFAENWYPPHHLAWPSPWRVH